MDGRYNCYYWKAGAGEVKGFVRGQRSQLLLLSMFLEMLSVMFKLVFSESVE